MEYLTERLDDSTNEKVDLRTAMVWVAEQDGKVIGMLPLRMVFQPEPLFIFPECKNGSARRKAAFLLLNTMEQWVGNRALNKTGIYSYFAVIKSRAFARMAKKWGCIRIYRTCQFWGKDL